MKKTVAGMLGLLFLLSVLVIPAAAATNLITDPNFNSLDYSGSFWKHVPDGSGSGSVSITHDPGYLYISASSSSSKNGYYVFVETNSKIDLTYVDEIKFNVGSVHTSSYQNNIIVVFVSDDGRDWEFIDSERTTGDHSFSVSSYSGQHYIRIGLYVTPANSGYCTIKNVHADDVSYAPVFSSGSLSVSSVNVGDSITATASFNAYPASGSTSIYWNYPKDEDVKKGLSISSTHTYQTVGTYTVYAVANNAKGYSDRATVGTVTVLPQKPVISSVTVLPSTTISPGTIVTFVANYQNEATSFTWNFGDGSTETGGESIYHTYSTAGTYTPTVTATGPGGTSETFTISTIYSGTNSISVDRGDLTYTSGDDVTFSWNLLNPDYSKGYTFRIYESDSAGTQYRQVITPVPITGASVTSHTWNTAGASGYYVGVIYEGSSVLVSSPVIMVQTMATLTVTLSVDAVTYTDETTVTLYRNGEQAYQQTTTSGMVQFSNIISGTYAVTAATVGYSQQSATISVLESTTINIDFKTGTSSGSTGQGAGNNYSRTYITFRIIDQNTGLRVSGAHVTGSAFEATNPVEWLVNQLGGAIGDNIIGTELAGVSDDNGVVSFIMYPNLRYNLVLEHDDLPEPSTRTFSPSSLSTEYPWYISFPHADETTKKNIKVEVTVSNEGLVNVTYKDLTQTTSSTLVNVYSKNETSNEYDIPFGSGSGGGYDATIQVQLQNYLGKDVKIVVTSNTGAYGQVVKTYYHTFLGPFVDLGLPSGVYIWICLLVAVLIGGVAPFVNSYAACFCIVFFEWMFWFFGWFFIPGQFVVLPLLIFATVLSILFYMQSRK